MEKCPRCRHWMLDEYQLEIHLITCPAPEEKLPKFRYCPYCKKAKKTKKGLERHMGRCPRSPSYQAEAQGIVFLKDD